MQDNCCKIEMIFKCKFINKEISFCEGYEDDKTRFLFDKDICKYENDKGECINKEIISKTLQRKIEEIKNV